MNAMKILSSAAIVMFPKRYSQWRRTREEKKDAMQAMLDACRKYRKDGKGTGYINIMMSAAMREYRMGRYENVAGLVSK